MQQRWCSGITRRSGRATCRRHARCSPTTSNFKGPIDEFGSADDYLASLGKLAQIVTGTDVQKVLADDEDVVTIYDLHTNTPAGTSPVAEWARVRNGKIAEIRVYFDARPFAAMFGQG
jgi:ketosteroid isomerase-like protein